jgi:excisionase family DNA binding protein
MEEDWITTNEAADLSGYHVNYIRQLVRARKLKARKFGPVWQVSKQSLLDYLARAERSDDKRQGPK